MKLPSMKLSEIKKVCNITGLTPRELEMTDDWLLLYDDDADDAVACYIENSLWAFNPTFLSYETGIDQTVFEAIQDNNRFEDNNEAIEAIIRSTCGMNQFIASAIAADGRGHFLSPYDGEEIMIAGDLMLYRLN